MAKVNVPKEMLAKDAFKTLPAKEKEEYVNNLLRRILSNCIKTTPNIATIPIPAEKRQIRFNSSKLKIALSRPPIIHHAAQRVEIA